MGLVASKRFLVAGKHPIMHNTASTTKNDLSPNADGARVEKPTLNYTVLIWARSMGQVDAKKRYIPNSVVLKAPICFFGMPREVNYNKHRLRRQELWMLTGEGEGGGGSEWT